MSDRQPEGDIAFSDPVVQYVESLHGERPATGPIPPELRARVTPSPDEGEGMLDPDGCIGRR